MIMEIVFLILGNAMITMIVAMGQMRLIAPLVAILKGALKDIVLKEHTLMALVAMIVHTV